MTAEEKEAHDGFCASIVASLQPADALESQLAHSVAEAHWRMSRVAAIEYNIFASDADAQAQNAPAVQFPDLDRALASAHFHRSPPALPAPHRLRDAPPPQSAELSGSCAKSSPHAAPPGKMKKPPPRRAAKNPFTKPPSCSNSPHPKAHPATPQAASRTQMASFFHMPISSAGTPGRAACRPLRPTTRGASSVPRSSATSKAFTAHPTPLHSRKPANNP